MFWIYRSPGKLIGNFNFISTLIGCEPIDCCDVPGGESRMQGLVRI